MRAPHRLRIASAEQGRTLTCLPVGRHPGLQLFSPSGAKIHYGLIPYAIKLEITLKRTN